LGFFSTDSILSHGRCAEGNDATGHKASQDTNKAKVLLQQILHFTFSFGLKFSDRKQKQSVQLRTEPDASAFRLMG